MISISPQWALMHSVLQAGPKGLHYVLGRGILPDHIGKSGSPQYTVFEFLLNYISEDRLPTTDEIEITTGVVVPSYDKPLSVELCSDAIVKGALQNQLLVKIGKIQDSLVDDPLKFREELYDLYHKTGWVKGSTVDRTSSTESVMSVVEAYDVAKSNIGSGIIGLSSPWPSWDKRSRGLQKGQLTILVAKRATGKSQTCFVWMDHIWKHDLGPNDKIMFVSMEMDALMVKRRLFAISAKLDYTKFTEGRLTPEDEHRFLDFCDDLVMQPEDSPEIVFLYPDQINSIRDIEVKAAEYKPALIVIDGLYIIGRGSNKSRWERTVDNVEEMKLRLAINYPIIATHQLKGTTKENTMKADADEMAYAKAIADYADVVLAIFADDNHRRGGQRTMRTLKGRDFVPIDWRINFNLETQDYSEIDVIDNDNPPEGTVAPEGQTRAHGPVFGASDGISL